MVSESIWYVQCSDSGRLILAKRFSLIDEHYGDIIANFIDKFACVADKTIAFFIEPDLSLALGTGDNVEKFLFNHGVISVEFE